MTKWRSASQYTADLLFPENYQDPIYCSYCGKKLNEYPQKSALLYDRYTGEKLPLPKTLRCPDYGKLGSVHDIYREASEDGR
jgi:hypothetical protein